MKNCGVEGLRVVSGQRGCRDEPNGRTCHESRRLRRPGRPRHRLWTDGSSARRATTLARRRRHVVVPWQMALVGAMLKILPRALYDRMFARAPRKPRRDQ